MYVRSRGFGQVNPTSIVGPVLNAGFQLLNYLNSQATERDDTTDIANLAEVQMENNTNQYQSCQISQAQAEQNFYTIWQWLVTECSQPQFGTAGGACVQDRQAGGKFDWFAGYLTPIETGPAPSCAAEAASTSNTSTSTSAISMPSVFGIPIPLAIGGLLLAAFLLRD